MIRLVVVLAAVILLYENRDQWFGGDEWYIVTDRGITAGPGHDGLFEPHFEHWTTLPIAAYRVLFAVFGLHSYWPYVVVLIAVHLVIVVLLWHVMVRSGIDAWVATAGCAVFAVLGTGFENLTGAWQAPLIAPLAFGLGALLVVPKEGPFGRRDAIASGLMVLGLMCSGVALAMLVSVLLVQLVRRGWRVALATGVAPVVVYAIWYVTYGRDGKAVTDVSLDGVPDFVWHGMTRAFGDLAGPETIGTIVVVAVLAWLAWRLLRDPRDPRLVVPGALTLGGVAFLASTGLRRANLFMADPAASRYAYVTIAFALPLVALAAQGLLRGDRLRRTALLAVTVALLVSQVGELDRQASSHAEGEQLDRGAVLATARLAREHRTFLLDHPLYVYEPQVTVDEIVSLDHDGKLPDLDDVTERDRLTVLARVAIAVGPDAAISGSEPPQVASSRQVSLTPQPGSCVRVSARGPRPRVVLRFAAPGVVRVSGVGPLVLHLRDERRGIDGDSVTYYLEQGREQVVSVATTEGALVMEWFPRQDISRGAVDRLCDVDAS